MRSLFYILFLPFLPGLTIAQVFQPHTTSDFKVWSNPYIIEEQTFLTGSEPSKYVLFEKQKFKFGQNGLTELLTEQCTGEKQKKAATYIYCDEGLKKVVETINNSVKVTTEYFYTDSKLERIFKNREANSQTNRSYKIIYKDNLISSIEMKDEAGGFFSSTTNYIYLGSEEDYFTEEFLSFQGTNIWKNTNEYDDGMLYKATKEEEGKAKKTYEYIYDKNNNLINIKLNDAVIELHVYEFDTRGNWVKQYILGFDEDLNNLIEKCIFRKITYNNKSKGNSSLESGSVEADAAFIRECSERHNK